jgi:hypothetical protein
MLTFGLTLAALGGLATVVVTFWTTRSDPDPVRPAESGPTASERPRSSDARFERAPVLSPRPSLRLIATAVSEDPGDSRATVHVEARGETMVVRPGDVVASDADVERSDAEDGGVASTSGDTVLYAVEPGRVELQRGEEYWILELTDEAPSREAIAARMLAVLSDPSLNPGEKAQELLEAKRGFPARENFTSEASFAPRLDDRGEMNGLYVRSVVYDGVYAQMGLAAGDVLLAVDGTTLDSPEASDSALEAFESSSSLRITRERAGEVESITVQRATPSKGED